MVWKKEYGTNRQEYYRQKYLARKAKLKAGEFTQPNSTGEKAGELNAQITQPTQPLNIPQLESPQPFTQPRITQPTNFTQLNNSTAPQLTEFTQPKITQPKESTQPQLWSNHYSVKKPYCYSCEQKGIKETEYAFCSLTKKPSLYFNNIYACNVYHWTLYQGQGKLGGKV